MLRTILCTMLAALATNAVAAGSGSHALTSSPFRNVVFLTEQVALDGQTATQAKIAPLTSSESGYTGDKLASPMPAFPVTPMPAVTISGAVGQDVALSASKSWMTYYLPGFASSMGAWLRGQGLSMATFNFTQDVNVTSTQGVKKQSIAFLANIDSSGRALYGEPKVIDPNPTTVQVVYTPLAVAAGLPQGWQFPNAGKIAWRILDKKMNALTNWAIIDVGGEFDADANNPDPDARLKCLFDLRNANCPVGGTDTRSLMNQTGSAFGLVDYVRQLEPTYHTAADGTLVADTAISVDNRTWNCSTYTNYGSWGMKLHEQEDVYLVQQSADAVSYVQLASAAAQAISPTQSYTSSASNGQLGGQNPDLYIVSPYPNDNPLLWYRGDANQMQNVVYVNPTLQQDLSSLSFNVTGTPAPIVASDGAGGTDIQFYATPYTNHYTSWPTFGGTATFTVGDISKLKSALLTYVGGSNTFKSIAVNGHTIWTNDTKGGFMFTCYPDPANPFGGWGSGNTTSSAYSNSLMFCDNTGSASATADSGTSCTGGDNGFCTDWTLPNRTVYPSATLAGRTGDTRDGVPWGSPGTVNINIAPYLVQGTNTITYSNWLSGFGDSGGGTYDIRFHLQTGC
jgi:hypothetical protein